MNKMELVDSSKKRATPEELIDAAKSGNAEAVKALLDKGVDVNAADKDDTTALIYTSMHGHTETVKTLLDKGANVNAVNNDGWTALMRASRNDHTETVKALLDKGANVNVADKDGWTALIYASNNGHTETVRALLDKGANVNAADKDGEVALMIASQNGHTQTVEALMEKAGVHFDITGKHPTLQEAEHLTQIPFHKSIQWGKISLWLLLIPVGIGIAIGAVYFAVLLFKYYIDHGPGEPYYIALALVVAVIAVVFPFRVLFWLFSSGRKKTPEQAFKWIWKESLLEGGNDERFGRLTVALDIIRRAIPASIPYNEDEMSRYITGLRDTMQAAMDETTLPARENAPGDWKEKRIKKEIVIKSVTELFPDVVEVRATITCKDIFLHKISDNAAVQVVSAVIELNIAQVFIRTGNYWYAYDLMPTVTPCPV
jgi:hypothetical protein